MRIAAILFSYNLLAMGISIQNKSLFRIYLFLSVIFTRPINTTTFITKLITHQARWFYVS